MDIFVKPDVKKDEVIVTNIKKATFKMVKAGQDLEDKNEF